MALTASSWKALRVNPRKVRPLRFNATAGLSGGVDLSFRRREVAACFLAFRFAVNGPRCLIGTHVCALLTSQGVRQELIAGAFPPWSGKLRVARVRPSGQEPRRSPALTRIYISNKAPKGDSLWKSRLVETWIRSNVV